MFIVRKIISLAPETTYIEEKVESIGTLLSDVCEPHFIQGNVVGLTYVEDWCVERAYFMRAGGRLHYKTTECDTWRACDIPFMLYLLKLTQTLTLYPDVTKMCLLQA